MLDMLLTHWVTPCMSPLVPSGHWPHLMSPGYWPPLLSDAPSAIISDVYTLLSLCSLEPSPRLPRPGGNPLHVTQAPAVTPLTSNDCH